MAIQDKINQAIGTIGGAIVGSEHIKEQKKNRAMAEREVNKEQFLREEQNRELSNQQKKDIEELNNQVNKLGELYHPTLKDIGYFKGVENKAKDIDKEVLANGGEVLGQQNQEYNDLRNNEAWNINKTANSFNSKYKKLENYLRQRDNMFDNMAVTNIERQKNLIINKILSGDLNKEQATEEMNKLYSSDVLGQIGYNSPDIEDKLTEMNIASNYNTGNRLKELADKVNVEKIRNFANEKNSVRRNNKIEEYAKKEVK